MRDGNAVLGIPSFVRLEVVSLPMRDGNTVTAGRHVPLMVLLAYL